MEFKSPPQTANKNALCKFAKYKLEITGYKGNVSQLAKQGKKLKDVKMSSIHASELNKQMKNSLELYEFVEVVGDKKESPKKDKPAE